MIFVQCKRCSYLLLLFAHNFCCDSARKLGSSSINAEFNVDSKYAIKTREKFVCMKNTGRKCGYTIGLLGIVTPFCHFNQ